MMRGATIAVLAALLLPGQAKAEGDGDTRWVRKSVRSSNAWVSCEWFGHCVVYRYRDYDERRRHVRRYYDQGRRELPPLRYYANSRNNERYDRRDDRREPICIDRSLSRVGEERYGKDRAKESAEQQWAEEVRSRWGVRYMDMRNAKRVTFECGRSSTGNRASEKAQEVLGKFLEQCTLEAIACRAEKESGEK